MNTTTRRTLISGAATAAVVAPAAAFTAVAEQDPHLAWAAEIARLEQLPEADDEAFAVTCDLICALQDRLASTPAHTLAGVEVQLRHVLDCHRDGSQLGSGEEQALENALATIKQLAGRA